MQCLTSFGGCEAEGRDEGRKERGEGRGDVGRGR